MNNKPLNRRGLLSGGTALLSTTLLPLRAAAKQGVHQDDEYILSEPIEEGVYEHIPVQVEEADETQHARHALFRTAFQSWLVTATPRFALPVSAYSVSPTHTELRVAGLSSALTIDLTYGGNINVHVTWNDVWWDIVSCHDVFLEYDASGWRNGSFMVAFQRLHPTAEDCWREDGFEPLLEWVNTELAPATHLALYGSNGWTAALLVRNGTIIRTGRPAKREGWITQLLPLTGTNG